jgi:alpha,alpha-trehalose phosphorylase
MRSGPDGLSFVPRLPPGLARLTFRMRYRGRIIMVNVRHHEASYRLLAGDPLAITHHGNPVTVGPDMVTHDIPPLKSRPSPAQPSGRAPQPRKTMGADPAA